MILQVGNKVLPIGCSSWSFGILPLEKSAKIIRVLGFGHLDVGFSHIRIDPSRSSLQQGRKLRRKLKRLGLTISDMFPSMPFDTNDLDVSHRTQNRAWFKRVIGYAEGAGSPGLTLKPGVRQNAHESDGWEVCVEVLSDYCAVARSSGLRLSVEPHVDSIVEDPKRTCELMQAVEGLSVTLDYSHFVAMGYPVDEVGILHQYVSHLHIRQARKGRVQSPAKSGNIPVKRILTDLFASGYSGAVTLEYQNSDWKDSNDIDVVSETVTTLRDLGFEI